MEKIIQSRVLFGISLGMVAFGFCQISMAQAVEVFRADYDALASGGTGNTSVTSYIGTLGISQSQFFDGRCSLVTSPQIVPGRPGTGVIRFETRQEDGNYSSTSGNRSELAYKSQSTGSSNNTTPVEIWYAWSAYLPDPAKAQPAQALWDGEDRASTYGTNAGDGGGREIYMQIHANDDVNLMGASSNPPLALTRIQDANNPNIGKWRLSWRWGYNRTSPLENAYADMPLELGQWSDFVLRVIWSDTAGQGVVQFWKNGQQMVHQTGIRVGYTGMKTTYFKEGVYAFDWNFTQTNDAYHAVVFYDEVKFFAGSTQYTNMRPSRIGDPLLEYAFNGDTIRKPGVLPQLSIATNQRLSLSFLRAHSDVTYIVQASPDLLNWQNVSTNPGTVSLTTPILFQDILPINTSSRFLRVQVAAP